MEPSIKVLRSKTVSAPPRTSPKVRGGGMKAKDGTVTLARSMEFGLNPGYELIVVPRNKSFVSPSPVSKMGLKWATQYGYLGVASMGLDFGVSDGMNEKGLSVSVLWYESDMQYQTVAPADSGKALAQAMYSDNESTQWVTFRDLTDRQFYFKTYDNPTFRVIDLKRLDFSATEVRRIPMHGTRQTIIDITK